MAKNTVHLDFETRSAAELKNVGAWEYSKHHTTSVNCLAWAWEEGPVQLWSRGDRFPAKLKYYIETGCFMAAWNAQFERYIWNHVCKDWPAVDFLQWRCTAAKSAYAGHPRQLAMAGKQLFPDQMGKDLIGAKIMKQMAKPLKKKKAQQHIPGLLWLDDPISTGILEAYCKQDVVVERRADHMLPEWPLSEVAIWQANERVNDRGAPFDRELCIGANKILDESLAETSEKISLMTEGEITTGNQIKRIKNFINERGVNTDTVDADAVETLLETKLADDVRDVLQLRQVCAGSAAKKYRSALHAISEDGRGRGLFLYCGASATGRFTSTKVQLHNLKKPGKDDPDIFVRSTRKGNLDLVKTLYGDTIISTLGNNVRNLVRAKPGHMLVRCDSSQIECRVLHWLAGSEKMLQTFRDGKDPYLGLASKVFNREIVKGDKERAIGKAGELGLGFGMGAIRFVGQVYSETGDTIDTKFAQMVVNLYRKDYPKVTKFWRDLENAAKLCITERRTCRVGKIVIGMQGDYMVVRLPSGRKSYYFKPAWEGTGRKQRFVYTDARSRRSEWAGGLLCENIVQGTARDTLVHYLRLAQAQGLNVVAHIHDELMIEVEESKAEDAMQVLLGCFASTLPWMEGLPCAAEAKIRKTYAG